MIVATLVVFAYAHGALHGMATQHLNNPSLCYAMAGDLQHRGLNGNQIVARCFISREVLAKGD